MKSKSSIIIWLVVFLWPLAALAEDLNIKSTNIQYDKENKITKFEGNVKAIDSRNNKVFTEYAEYDKIKELFKTQGDTKIITSQGFELNSKNIILNNKDRIILSNESTEILDKDGNKVSVEMFNYLIDTNIFFSKGNISLKDINKNEYYFSEIYIDEMKKKIVGSDVKAFLNQEDFLIKKTNEPRFFANTMTSSNKKSNFQKGIFTYCENRGEDKCPPWALQSEKIEHDIAKKTIYYKNVVLKIYDFPIFFLPKFSHPDPTVQRRSGFLAPTLTTSTTVGSGFAIPYFFNISKDKDFTFTPKLYAKENPLLLGEYRQDFINSFLIVDGGYTQGYKKKTEKKSPGGRAHFFSKFRKDFIKNDDIESNLEVNLQRSSNDTYFKVHDINTSLVDKNINILENKIDYTYQTDEFFFGANLSAFENINKTDREKYEYLLPINFDTNLFSSENMGSVDISSNFRLKNYEVNRQTEILSNDFEWVSNKWINKFGFENQFKGLFKAVNYNAENTKHYKNDDFNSELSGALGFITELGLFKNGYNKKNIYTMTPKMLVRYAPGHMRNIRNTNEGSVKLNYSNIFDLNKVNEMDVLENGLSSSLGFDFKKNEISRDGNIGKEKLSLSIGQVINSEENMDVPASSSLDQRFSDVVGESKLSVNNNLELKYNFSIDQSYKSINYNEIEADLDVGKAKFNLSYLEEKEHLGNQEYVKTGFDLALDDAQSLNFSTKRNLLTSSAEFYNLSYTYTNDCLKAGLVYRREFYTDRDLEPANSLMFTISIIPFADINSPTSN